MPCIRPPRLFPPRIAERDLLYFEHGKVRAVRKTFAGRYQAEVRRMAGVRLAVAERGWNSDFLV